MVVEAMTKQNDFEVFKTKAEAFGATVDKASSPEEAISVIADLITTNGYKSVVSTELTKISLEELTKAVQEKGVKIDSGRPKRAIIEVADVGITEFDFGIVNLGTLAQDATDPYARLMSMLPSYHIALIKTETLVQDFATALTNIYTKNGKQMPSYVSYVSGPSRTADIERVLTIGVHGPSRLHIVLID